MNLDEVRMVVETAIKFGAAEAEAFYLKNDVFTARIANRKIVEAKGAVDEGLAVRVLTRDNGLGFSSTSKLDEEGIREAISRAIKIASKRKLKFKYSMPKPQKYSIVEGTFDGELANLTREHAVELAHKAINSAEEYSDKIVDIAGTINIVKYQVRIVNSNGLEAEDRGTFIEGVIATTAKDYGVESEGYESLKCRYLSDFDPEFIGRESAKMAVDGLKAKRLTEGTYTAIFAPRASADIALRVGTFSNPIIAKTTLQFFLGKEGELVASEKLTILDDPRMPKGPHSCSIDDEGVPTRTKYLLENGVFKGFYYDSKTAAMESKESTGNGFRPPGPAGFTRLPGKLYITEPTPRPSTLVIRSGSDSLDDLISEVKNGLLVKHLHYARISNTVTGDYTAVLRMGLYKIEHGEIAYAVKKSRILDNILKMLSNVDAVANDVRVAGQWGNYAVAPSLRIKQLKVVPVD